MVGMDETEPKEGTSLRVGRARDALLGKVRGKELLTLGEVALLR
jgi:hypothetical protein